MVSENREERQSYWPCVQVTPEKKTALTGLAGVGQNEHLGKEMWGRRTSRPLFLLARVEEDVLEDVTG